MSAEEGRVGGPSPRLQSLTRLFAFIGLAAVFAVILVFAGISMLGSGRQPAKVAGAKPEETFTLINVRDVQGTNLIAMDVAAGERRGSGSYYGSRDDVRNILLLDKASGISRKLLPDNGRRILNTRFLPAEGGLVSEDLESRVDAFEADDYDGQSKPPSPEAYYILSVEQPGKGDRIDVLVGTLSNGKQNYVLRGMDGIDSIWMQSPTQIGMVVREQLNLFHRVVDIPSLKVVRSTRIDVD